MKLPILGMIMLILGMTGCASKRFITDEQDKELRELCQAKGCAVVPNDVMEMLLNMLDGKRV